MGNLFLPNQAVDYLTRRQLGTFTPTSLPYTYGLYTTLYTPTLTDTIALYLGIECSLSGYAEVVVVASAWSGSTTGGVSSYLTPAYTYTFSAYGGGTTIYGLFQFGYDASGAKVLTGATLLDVPYIVPSVGGSWTFTPTWGDQSL
jgi:hypothetical protein